MNPAVTCPRCQSRIDNDRLKMVSTVCQNCGWQSKLREIDDFFANEIRIIFGSLFLAATICFSFIHMVKWDKYSTAVLPLQIKQLTGELNRTETLKFAKICEARSQYRCLEKLYLKQLSREKNQGAWLAKLAEAQFKMGRYEKALRSFAGYFKAGGKSPEIAYKYARTFERLGRFKQAESFYLYALKSKPWVLQTTIASNYVKLLMKSRQYRKAFQAIQRVRKKGSNTRGFMEAEYQRLMMAKYRNAASVARPRQAARSLSSQKAPKPAQQQIQQRKTQPYN